MVVRSFDARLSIRQSSPVFSGDLAFIITLNSNSQSLEKILPVFMLMLSC